MLQWWNWAADSRIRNVFSFLHANTTISPSEWEWIEFFNCMFRSIDWLELGIHELLHEKNFIRIEEDCLLWNFASKSCFVYDILRQYIRRNMRLLKVIQSWACLHADPCQFQYKFHFELFITYWSFLEFGYWIRYFNVECCAQSHLVRSLARRWIRNKFNMLRGVLIGICIWIYKSYSIGMFFLLCFSYNFQRWMNSSTFNFCISYLYVFILICMPNLHLSMHFLYWNKMTLLSIQNIFKIVIFNGYMCTRCITYKSDIKKILEIAKMKKVICNPFTFIEVWYWEYGVNFKLGFDEGKNK